jgi:fatty-acyl-CoA synthase
MSIIERISNDLVFFSGALRSLRRTMPIAKHPDRVFPHVVDELAQRFGDAPALLSERENFTYRELAARANRYARWALEQGIAKGDVVCLMMPNRPEYLAIWLGVTKVGGIVALINTNLVAPSLAHCIDIVAPKHVIAAAESFDAFAGAQPRLESRPAVWLHGEHAAGVARIDRAVEGFAGDPLGAAERRALTIEDSALYVYTSGTTGQPKAANVNHYRIMLASYGFAGVMNTRPSDRMYDCLPMYHTAGGLCAIGSLLVAGGSVAIRERFSAREFWRDVARYDCTLFQYIGELCRYLVHAPRDADADRHRLRLACGNGLRPDIWNEFQRRFRIPRIVEFYAATEGNVLLFNFEGKPGAVGRLPRLLARRYPVAIVAFDLDRQQPLRDTRGFCIACAPGEVGEAIGRIARDPTQPGGRFDGYADKDEDERKILRDVFARGDAWFRTGDLMKQDASGYFYFVDRIGDTFRWKGENVSTAEVAETICAFAGVLQAGVYGVAVPGCDGRAGMAAVAAAPDLDLAALRAHLARRLPGYARPLFLRVCEQIEVTATFKQRKSELIRQGFDPANTSDAIYFDDPDRQAFVPLDAALYRRICRGEIPGLGSAS